MDPTLYIALARLGIKLGTDLVRGLKSEGWEPTDEQLVGIRAASIDALDEWNALSPD